MCMPDGLRFKKNLEDPLSHKSTHTFCITKENGSRTYGTVLAYYERTTDLKLINSFEALQTKYLERRCPLTQPHITSKQQDHDFSIATDTLHAPKCLCLVTTAPAVFRPLRAYLEQLHAVALRRVSSSSLSSSEQLPLESYLYNLLYEVPLPGPGKTLHFVGPLGKFVVSCPSLLELPPCDYSFQQLFELLGIRVAIRLVTCLLLEHQVLLKSSDLERLSLVATCSTALLWPFSWPHVFVPFLPASQRGFLDAPVPYLMGLRVDSASQDSHYSNLANVSSLCTVNLDRGLLDCPDEIPPLPDQSRLMLLLSEKLLEHGTKVSDLMELPRSPSTNTTSTTTTISSLGSAEFSPSPPNKHSMVEALRWVEEYVRLHACETAVG